MRKKTSHEQQKANLLKAAKAAIRLRHSIEADVEINDRIPDIEAKIDAALAAGEVYALDIESILEEAA